MSSLSTTASMIMSQSLSFGRSSSKFPTETSDAARSWKNAAGFAFFAASSPARATRSRTSSRLKGQPPRRLLLRRLLRHDIEKKGRDSRVRKVRGYLRAHRARSEHGRLFYPKHKGL